jgi:hypothetical protein
MLYGILVMLIAPRRRSSGDSSAHASCATSHAVRSYDVSKNQDLVFTVSVLSYSLIEVVIHVGRLPGPPSRCRIDGSLGGGFPESSANFKLHMPKVALLRKSSNR